MSAVAHRREIKRLVRLLAAGSPVELGAIPWASPVMMFGRLQTSRVATLGLNPSNLEFVDARGAQLHAPLHRFETLSTLQLDDWANAEKEDIERVWSACELYFTRRPYDGWFKPLDRVISGLGVSYYDAWSSACHLDLVPFATGQKWSSLAPDAKQGLLEFGVKTLVTSIATSHIRVLVLNGATVVRTFERLLSKSLKVASMPAWNLGRQGSSPVQGLAYLGVVTELAGMNLGRELLVLGFNHNIQSSFGVTREAVTSISEWIARQGRGVLA
jgi:hypothetical protein